MLPQTLIAMDRARACARFGDMLLVTDRAAQVAGQAGVRIAAVESLRSREEYSRVVQTGLTQHIHTPFVMLVQWDGYPVRPENWTDAFLDYDYVGAPWPQFPSAIAVGNGGFSLRSRRLLDACDDPLFSPGHPEDIVICHTNRALLEQAHGVRFAPVALAERFSCERMGSAARAFGFHGLFNMPREMGEAAFLAFFATLDRRQIGVRELCDVREVLLRAGTPAARREARHILSDLMRRRWRDPALWRYGRRKLTGGSSALPCG
ncbi:MAG TPA: DUF5672 family protein [Sphingobium sp.]|nr:DUF5672 family protein [Sphingobium sp.]